MSIGKVWGFIGIIAFSYQPSAAQTIEAHLCKDSVLMRTNELKALVDRKFWPSFNEPQYALSIHYYEDGPFRMHLVQSGKDTKPRMECSSPEITFLAVPGLSCYEEWYAMLIHECFHGFQYKKYPLFWQKMIEETPEDFYASDSLKALKRDFEWYSKWLDQENELLKRMYKATDICEVQQLWAVFMPLRKERLRLVKEKLGLDIELFYPMIEAMEGSARYIEYCLYQELDIAHLAGWMTNLEGDSYYYTSGLYLILILEKFGIDYQDELFKKFHTLTELMSEKLKMYSMGYGLLRRSAFVPTEDKSWSS